MKFDCYQPFTALKANLRTGQMLSKTCLTGQRHKYVLLLHAPRIFKSINQDTMERSELPIRTPWTPNTDRNIGTNHTDAGGPTNADLLTIRPAVHGRLLAHVPYECSICLARVKCPLRTPCLHVFCATCIIDWLSEPHQDCPDCRADLITSDLRSLDVQPLKAKQVQERTVVEDETRATG